MGCREPDPDSAVLRLRPCRDLRVRGAGRWATASSLSTPKPDSPQPISHVAAPLSTDSASFKPPRFYRRNTSFLWDFHPAFGERLILPILSAFAQQRNF